MPVLLFAPAIAGMIISAVILAVLIFTAYWIPKYCISMVYRLTDHDMTWRRGVWFKKTGIVPYNRITNVDIDQGPHIQEAWHRLAQNPDSRLFRADDHV